MGRCYHCAERLGNFSDRYEVRKAIKPKGHPFRWKVIGYMCETCESAGCCAQYDEFNKGTNK